MAYNHKTCLCTKFEVIWTNENRVTGKRSWRIFYYVIWENGLEAFSCPPSWLPQYKCMGIFNTLNSRNFCIYWSIDLKLAEIFQNGVIYSVLKFCPKIINSNFWWRQSLLEVHDFTITAVTIWSESGLNDRVTPFKISTLGIGYYPAKWMYCTVTWPLDNKDGGDHIKIEL